MNQPTNILRFPEVQKRIGLCRSRIYQLIKKGQFPSQIKLSERASGWVEFEIDLWIEERIKASREGSNHA